MAEDALKIPCDPMGHLIAYFLEADMDELEVVCPEPGSTVGEVTFLETPDVTPEKVYQKIYGMTLRMGILKSKVWVNKEGRSTWLRKYDPKDSTS